MRLIDADALKEYCMRASKSDDDFRRVSLATLASVIDAQPTAYDVDKVVEKLEKRRMDALRHLRENKGTEFGYASECVYNALNEAVEIVKGGGFRSYAVVHYASFPPKSGYRYFPIYIQERQSDRMNTHPH